MRERRLELETEGEDGLDVVALGGVAGGVGLGLFGAVPGEGEVQVQDVGDFVADGADQLLGEQAGVFAGEDALPVDEDVERDADGLDIG